MLRPYQDPNLAERAGWEEFRCRIVTALSTYWSISEPVGVRRIGVRYINKIKIPQMKEDINEYMRYAPPSAEDLPGSVTQFAGRTEYRYDDEVHLLLSQGLASASQDQVAYLLDIDVIWKSRPHLDFESAIDKAAELRHMERQAFETVITDKARELFDAT